MSISNATNSHVMGFVVGDCVGITSVYCIYVTYYI